MRSTIIGDSRLLELPKIQTEAGSITSINNNIDIEFSINRSYYLYDVPGGSSRGGHAHKNLRQLIVAASGSFDIIINDGQQEKRIHLNQPYLGLYLPPGLWRELDNFSSGSICLVLASEEYSEDDYIRDYKDFVGYKQKN